MPNGLAYLMLMVWPLVTVSLFRLLPIERAVVWSILGAYLVLPPIAAFDLPMVPPLDKFAISNLSAWAACTFVLGKRVPLVPDVLLGRLLMLMFVVGPVLTVLTNTDPLVFRMAFIPGLRVHDSVSVVANQAIAILPLFLARRFLATETGLREILFALVLAGLAYSLPMLVEIRMSPQINVWIYGFFQHDFIQMVRQGGYRPMVFLPHGLWAAFFALMAFLAAVALWRFGPEKRRGLFALAAGYLGILLVLCKSAGVLVFGALAAPMIRFLPVRRQVQIAAVLALVALAYPLLRGANLVPVDWIVEKAAGFSVERADSLSFRLENEDSLLAKAAERPLFGWGSWGRNHIYDPVTGEATSTTDGRWIIVIGSLGWVGYCVEFGLLALPIVMLAMKSLRRRGAALSDYCGPIALILAVNMIDMLPNATLVPFTWLMAGAILGYAEARPTVAAGDGPATPEQPSDRDGIAARPRTII